ncbi:MAG: hypothetical protein ACOYT8_05235 [Candidatus Dependentiae bacterium]
MTPLKTGSRRKKRKARGKGLKIGERKDGGENKGGINKRDRLGVEV